VIDMDVSEERSLAECLEETPAGVELAALLASVDRSQLDRAGLLRLAAARQRQVAHDEARLLADLHAVAQAFPDDDESLRRQGRYTWAEVETAMALRWTQGRASTQINLAEEVIDRLPQLHTAIAEGHLDIPKTLVITTLLGSVDTDLARALVDRVIDKARDWTTAQLRSRLRRLLIAADPAAARTKAGKAVKDRRVISWLDDDDHLAYLSGQALAPHRVAAVLERLDAVVKAAKAAGDERTTDQIRADVFLDLLSGEGIAAGGPITDGTLGLVDPGDPVTTDPHTGCVDAETTGGAARVPPPTDPPPPSGSAAGGEDLPEPVTPPDPDGLALEPVWSLWPPLAEDARDTAEADSIDTPWQRAAWLADFDRLPAAKPATWCLLCGHTTGDAATPGPMPGPRRGVVELVATTDTLMGLADLPAEITGMGAVTADIARKVAAEMRDARWRYSVYDPLKRLMHHGVTSQRPTEPVDEAARDPRRFPTAAQAAWVAARDRTCVAPGCRRTARRCDVDHTLDWVKGGKTVHCNLGLLCRAHHLLKHATGSELIQSVPGIFHWRTPSGLRYRTTSEPPLLLDADQLVGTPTSPTPDAGRLDANHTAEEWALPSSLGADPHALSVDDLLLPEDIDDPDNLPIPERLTPDDSAGDAKSGAGTAGGMALSTV
jgi:hypothetical protein